MKKWMMIALSTVILASSLLACRNITDYSPEINVAMNHMWHEPNIDASALAGDYYHGDDLLSIEKEEGEKLYSIDYVFLSAGNLGFDGKIIDVTDSKITVYVDEYDFMEQKVDKYNCATFEYTLENGVLTLKPEGTFYLNGIGDPDAE